MDHVDKLIVQILRETPDWTFTSRAISREIEKRTGLDITPSVIGRHFRRIDTKIRVMRKGSSSTRVRVKYR